MPKLKTNKAAKKRYSLTATGKVKRTTANKRHLLANKTKSIRNEKEIGIKINKSIGQIKKENVQFYEKVKFIIFFVLFRPRFYSTTMIWFLDSQM